MPKVTKRRPKADIKAQSLLEYAVLIGIVAGVVMAMGPYLKRGVQSIVKVTADQLAPQNLADQSSNSGYLINAFTAVRGTSQRGFKEMLDVKDYTYDETTEEHSMTLTNLGIINKN